MTKPEFDPREVLERYVAVLRDQGSAVVRDVADGERVSAPRSLKTLERRLDALEKRLSDLPKG